VEAAAAPKRRQVWLAWTGAAALWLLLAFKLDSDASGGAEQAGYVAGGYVLTIVLAAVIRGVYYLVRRRQVPFWSPWLLVIAAAVGLLARVPDIGKAAERSENVAAAEAKLPGDESQAVTECIEGGFQRYNEVSAEERKVFSRADWQKMIGRMCKEAERRGIFEQEELGEAALQAKMTEIAEEVYVEMVESGELSSS
jgi:hypothetical protein